MKFEIHGYNVFLVEFDFLVQPTAWWRRHRLQHPVHRSLNRSGGLGQRNGGDGGNVVRRDGADTGGGDDGGFGLAEKPLNGLPVRAVAKFPHQLEHPSGTQNEYSHAAATAIDFSVPVLGGQRRPIRILERPNFVLVGLATEDSTAAVAGCGMIADDIYI
ncbi:hypothetical protein Adt_34142 [Abeliophyllum distichum]|uniref:Uncharacterized protein n=1 Tax=Abeliophyllum distichum TaxID=126358 RepID=A0ABD1QY93_9LAMI